MKYSWRWAGACSIGTSHLKLNLECQDRASCIQTQALGQEYLSVVVSDGAGSASQASKGAATVCTYFQRSAINHLRKGNLLEKIDEEIVASWIDTIRDAIGFKCNAAGLKPRDYAATLVAAMIGDDKAVIIHIGDGAVVLRNAVTGKWSVPSWPFQGEYASTTRFIIDDPQPQFDLVIADGRFDRVAVFSDGLERLVLDHRERIAPAEFFNRLTDPVANSANPRRNRILSKYLRSYLESEKVCAATDDDKSLILGARV